MLKVITKDDAPSKAEQNSTGAKPVSPYLERARRSYEEVLRERERRECHERKSRHDACGGGGDGSRRPDDGNGRE